MPKEQHSQLHSMIRISCVRSRGLPPCFEGSFGVPVSGGPCPRLLEHCSPAGALLLWVSVWILVSPSYPPLCAWVLGEGMVPAPGSALDQRRCFRGTLILGHRSQPEGERGGPLVPLIQLLRSRVYGSPSPSLFGAQGRVACASGKRSVQRVIPVVAFIKAQGF